MRIVVLGYLVRGPLGGMAWHQVQYARGLADLGHDVWFVEDSDEYASCYDPRTDTMTEDCAYGLSFAVRELARLGLGDRLAFFDAHAACWRGPAATQMPRLIARADVLVNLCGVNPWRPWLDDVAHRVLVDCDPAFTQIRHLTDPIARDVAARHTAFFTFGECFGRPGSAIPDDGLPWQCTRQPILLDRLCPARTAVGVPWTSVLQWVSYPAREHGGRRFGTKRESFEDLLDLPARVDAELMLAIGAPDDVRARLHRHGWHTRDPLVPTRDIPAYHRFVAASRGELAVAKEGYVVSRSGWFSERSATYLASGRPVVAQDTGWSEVIAPGDGLLAFDDAAGAADAIAAVERHPDRHAAAARGVAERHFDARAVLDSLLQRAR